MALSKIPHFSAAQALLPLINDAKAEKSLRIKAIEAAGADGLEDAVKELTKTASSDSDSDLRFKALLALSVNKLAWKDGEKLFVDGLADPRDDIRTLCAKVCHQAAVVRMMYVSAEPKLLELAEKDAVVPVRCNAMAALARMQSKASVAVLIRILGDAGAPAPVTKQALAAFTNITGVPLRDASAGKGWWEKFGKSEYEKAKLLSELPKPKEPEKKAETAQEPAKLPAKLPPLPDDRPADHPFVGVPMGTEQP